jgi:putative transposase
MPNHFHFVLHPRNDGDLSVFMKMVTLTHAQRYRTMSNTIGEGPVYQGRYKSFIIQDDTHLFTVLRYVERNPLTARLVDNPLDWKYSSLYRRHVGTEKQKETLSPWIIDEPSDYLKLMEQPLSLNEREKLELSENKGVPYGDEQYVIGKVGQYGLESTVRGKGRPKKR